MVPTHVGPIASEYIVKECRVRNPVRRLPISILYLPCFTSLDKEGISACLALVAAPWSSPTRHWSGKVRLFRTLIVAGGEAAEAVETAGLPLLLKSPRMHWGVLGEEALGSLASLRKFVLELLEVQMLRSLLLVLCTRLPASNRICRWHRDGNGIIKRPGPTCRVSATAHSSSS
jgi:hypothetical protein